MPYPETPSALRLCGRFDGESRAHGGADVDGFQCHDPTGALPAKVRVATRTFTTFASRGGVAFVLSGAWQLGDKLLTADQGASWQEGSHTLRLLETKGSLLFSEITGCRVIEHDYLIFTG